MAFVFLETLSQNLVYLHWAGEWVYS